MPTPAQAQRQLALLDASDAAPSLRTWPPEPGAVATDWQATVALFWASPQGKKLSQFVTKRLAKQAIIYPPEPLRALRLTPLNSVRVVILGQDPYHGPGQAEGLAFSVAPGVIPPPSLRNIFKELHQEGLRPAHQVSTNGSLTSWAQQGVLLLNTCLTVEDSHPASHAKKGWEALTDAIVAQIAQTAQICVFMLWGAHAQAKAPMVQQPAAAHSRNILMLQANHPSPLSANRPPTPFMGCDHFQAANDFLVHHGARPIHWNNIPQAEFRSHHA
jgi:uracil-DNA glycosylase